MTKTVKKDKRLIRKWIKALRSGKYQQGRNALRNKDKEFCCLGVACDIVAKEQKKGLHQVAWSTVDKYSSTEFIHNARLQARLGLTMDKQVELARLNDDLNHSFADIADNIEKTILNA